MGIKNAVKGLFKKPTPKPLSIYGKKGTTFPGADLYKQQLRDRLSGRDT